MIKIKKGSLVKFGRIRFRVKELVTKNNIKKASNTQKLSQTGPAQNTSRLNKVQIDNHAPAMLF